MHIFKTIWMTKLKKEKPQPKRCAKQNNRLNAWKRSQESKGPHSVKVKIEKPATNRDDKGATQS